MQSLKTLGSMVPFKTSHSEIFSYYSATSGIVKFKLMVGIDFWLIAVFSHFFHVSRIGSISQTVDLFRTYIRPGNGLTDISILIRAPYWQGIFRSTSRMCRIGFLHHGNMKGIHIVIPICILLCGCLINQVRGSNDISCLSAASANRSSPSLSISLIYMNIERDDGRRIFRILTQNFHQPCRDLPCPGIILSQRSLNVFSSILIIFIFAFVPSGCCHI